ISATQLVNSGNVHVSESGTLATSAYSGHGHIVLVAAAMLTFQLGAASDFVGPTSGGGGLTKPGGGTVRVSGVQEPEGGTTVSHGSFVLDGGSLADTGAVNVGATGRFVLATAEKVASLNTAGRVDLDADLTASGMIVNNGSMAISGSRT